MITYEFPLDDFATHKSYDYAVIKNAFDKISHAYEIEYDFPQGGCQQRSHLLSLLLSKKFNLEHSKLWLFSPAALSSEDQRTLYVTDKNGLSNDNIVNWNYHTAPVLKLKNGGKGAMLVIDPSIDRAEALSLEVWLSKIGNSNLGRYTFLKPQRYFFNCQYNDYFQLTNIFDGTFFDFVNPAKDNLLLEKGLAINDMAMVIYKKHIAPRSDNGDVKMQSELKDLKDIFGNATALDLLFSQNLSGFTDNTSYRYVLTRYGAIMKEAKQLFHERLLFWTRFTNELF